MSVTSHLDNLAKALLEARDLAERSRDKQPKSVTAAGAMALHVADVTVSKLDKALKIARETNDHVRARYRDLIPLSEDEEEAENGIRTMKVGRFRIRVTPVAGTPRFSLKDYVAKGHEITPEMRDAIKDSSGFDRWTIADERGPRRADAVEL